MTGKNGRPVPNLVAATELRNESDKSTIRQQKEEDPASQKSKEESVFWRNVLTINILNVYLDNSVFLAKNRLNNLDF